MPLSARSAASWVCEVTGCAAMTSAMRACRAGRVSAAVIARAGATGARGATREWPWLVSRSLQEPDEDSLLGVQPVLGLVPHDALRPVDDRGGDLLAPVGGQA